MTEPVDAIAADITTEALRLTGRIAAAKRKIRLMGGAAVWLVAPSVRRPPYARPYGDLDFAAGGSDRKGTGAFFEAAGYVPEKLFNAIHGATRLNYRHRPALLAIQRPGWEHVERSYREALLHQRRSDEWRESLTAAAAAVEAALKAAGYAGATLGALVKDFRRSPIAAGYSPEIVEHLAELIEQLMAWRSHSGSAHGKEPGFTDPPPQLVALAIHWAGSFIVYRGSLQ